MRKEGINREKIVLSGVNKEKKDILYTMKTGAVGIYTVESLNQLELINACAVECGIKVKVLIRVTSGNQFGINERQIYEIADRKMNSRELSLREYSVIQEPRRRN